MENDWTTTEISYQYSKIGTRWHSTPKSSIAEEIGYPTGTPRSIEDLPGRTRGEGRVKRRTTETSGSREPTSIIDELKAQCLSLQEKVTQLELYAASRDQIIRDMKSSSRNTRTQNQNVVDEFNTLNQRLMYSTNEVAAYQAELMIASQEDEGATLRIEELERRGALMENEPGEFTNEAWKFKKNTKMKYTISKDFWVTPNQG